MVARNRHQSVRDRVVVRAACSNGTSVSGRPTITNAARERLAREGHPTPGNAEYTLGPNRSYGNQDAQLLNCDARDPHRHATSQ